MRGGGSVVSASLSLGLDDVKPPQEQGLVDAGPKAALTMGAPVLSDEVKVLVAELLRVSGGSSPASLKRLFLKFQALDVERAGVMGYGEFCKLLDLEPSALARRMFRLFDKEGSGVLDIRVMLVGLSAIGGAGEGKFGFSMFDEDNSGTLVVGELLGLLKANFVVVPLEISDLKRRAELVLKAAGRRAVGARNLTLQEYLGLMDSGLIKPSNLTLGEVERSLRL